MAIVRKLSGLQSQNEAKTAGDTTTASTSPSSPNDPLTTQKKVANNDKGIVQPNPQDSADHSLHRSSSSTLSTSSSNIGTTNNVNSTTTTTKQESPLRRFASVVLPILNGLLHLRVFLMSVSLLFLRTTANTTPEQQQQQADSSSSAILNIEQAEAYSASLDYAVFFAYMMDLVSTFVFKMIPLSRVTDGMDIFVHHMPIIVMVLMGLPASTRYFYAWDPWFHEMISYAHNQSHILAPRFSAPAVSTVWLLQKSQRIFHAAFLGQGFGFMSSLNEVLMSFQQAELNWNRVPSLWQAQQEWFDDRKTISTKFFTRPLLVGVELYFKVSIFCGWGVLCFFALTRLWWESLDYVLHYYNSSDDGTVYNPDYEKGLAHQAWAMLSNPHLLSAVGSLLTSPMLLRSMVSIVFLATMYPAMAYRTMNKIRRYHTDVYRRQEQHNQRRLSKKNKVE